MASCKKNGLKRDGKCSYGHKKGMRCPDHTFGIDYCCLSCERLHDPQNKCQDVCKHLDLKSQLDYSDYYLGS